MENRIIKISKNIIGVIVPERANIFKISGTGYLCYKNTKYDSQYELIEDSIFDNHKIHGICTLPELEFDFEVDESWVKKKWLDKTESYVYLDYTSINKNQYFIMSTDSDNKNKSFRTRIQKAIQDEGLLLVNPYQEPNHLHYKTKNQFNELVFMSEYQKNLYSDNYDIWQESESKVIKGNILIIEKI